MHPRHRLPKRSRVPFALLLAALGGCVSTGSIAETQPLTADATSFALPKVAVVASDADWQQDAREFERIAADPALGELDRKVAHQVALRIGLAKAAAR